jgi:hypothetical protein
MRASPASPGARRQSCRKAPGGSGQPRQPPARLRKNSGRLRDAPGGSGQLREAPGGSGRLRASPATAGKAPKWSGALQAVLATAGKAAERLREALGSPGHRRQGCGKAPGESGQPWRPPAGLRKGSGSIRDAPGGTGRLREAPGSFGKLRASPATAGKAAKWSGRLQAAQMHVIYAANELQAAIAHGRRCKSSASCEQTL